MRQQSDLLAPAVWQNRALGLSYWGESFNTSKAKPPHLPSGQSIWKHPIGAGCL